MASTPSAAATPAVGIRERNRVELTAEILTSARRHLLEHGPADLSLRAITRDLGMASSAIYRYFSSRDELLTALIIEAYNDLADRVEEADGGVAERGDHQARWLAIGSSMRDWAKANPHQWALIYGTPIRGYAAPQDTIASATRATGPLLRLMVDAGEARDQQAGTQQTNDKDLSVLATDLTRILADMGGNVSQQQAADGLGAWAQIIGLISLELFGHLVNVVSDPDAHFAYLVDQIGIRLAFTSSQ